MSFEKPSSPERPASLNDKETVAYLMQHGAQPLSAWRPGEAVLYVLEDMIRENDDNLSSYSRDQVPSIVRVDSPTKIDFDKPVGSVEGHMTYRLENDGSQVAYYAINRVTQKPQLIRISHRVTTPTSLYVIREAGLFNAKDDLFPKAEE